MVVEDHPMVRAGLRALFDTTDEFRIVAEAASHEEAVSVYAEVRPDVVCIDLMLGEDNGLLLIRELKRLDPSARILVVSVRDEKAYAERCLQTGALGYVMKREKNAAVLDGLRAVARGDIYVSDEMAMHIVIKSQKGKDTGSGINALSDRELEVFQLTGMGLSSRQIAQRLRIGIKTVETHRDNIRAKLGLPHAAALVREAMLWVQSNAE